MTADISRHSLRPAQRYTAVVRQQGRLPLDSDETEADDLGTLLLRQGIAETICARGTPDDGFRISSPSVTDGALDFAIAAGSFYLAGHRCETADITYRAQPDWLTFPLDSPGPSIPAANTTRTDLVWLQAWEQEVTATEDAELFERALGGADTTARRRMLQRVRVLESVPADCADALADMAAREYPGGTLDAEAGEVLSDARLTIGFTQLEPLEDLCRPSAQAGFLGARNEAFRIQVTTPGRFVWGRDNAAPLYRVQLAANAADGLRRRIVFLTLPRDEFGWPLAGMTVELLRWGALLDNREKAAEPAGLLLRVENGFNPADASILVAAAPPAAWEAWFATPEGQAALNPRDDPEVNSYFFLRVWTGGGAAAAVDHPMNIGNPVPLGETGLTATFSAAGLAGDYWVVAARPNTPTQVTPWALLDGAAPIGPRRLVAPLALLPWNGATPGTPIDCRHRFRPLCRVGTCCIVTVGDGRNSHGDVASIQEAIDRLPPEGGEVCLHPGEYVEHVTIDGRRAVTITGCGRGTIWRGEASRADPLLQVTNAASVVVRRLAMVGSAGVCIRAEDLPAQRPEGGAALENLLLEDLGFTIADFGAVAALGGSGHTLRRCGVTLEPMSAGLNDSTVIGRAAAFFLLGSDLTVEQCRILAPAEPDRLRLAVGGIHIGGGSERVIIRDNVIHGGNGHGITLGSVQFVPDQPGQVVGGPSDFTSTLQPGAPYYPKGEGDGIGYYGIGILVDSAGCIRWPATPPDEDLPEGTPLFPDSGGLVRDVQILRNDIAAMGYSGISAHVFAGLGRGGFADAIAVEAIEIADNRIQGCMLNEIGATTPLLRQFIGWGGIALSICADATMRDNLIAGNGADSAEPISGIFLAIAEDVRIERNRIERNGADPALGQALAPGRRGGIVVGVALGGVSSYGEAALSARAADRPALLVAGNTVEAPGARALKAILLGPGMVLGNRLTGAARSAFASNVFGSLAAAGLATSRIGGQLFSAKAEIDLLDYAALELLSDILGGDAVNLVSLCVAEDLVLEYRSSIAGTYVPQRLRGGELMVNDNQISLRRHSPEFAVSLSAVLLLGADDIAFCDNQAEVENEVVFVLTNVLAVSASLRLGTNRLQERITAAILSAVTFGVMNQTAYNQTTHCIFAAGLLQGRVVTGNRAVFGIFLPGFCTAIEQFALSLSGGIGARYGLGAPGNGGG